MLVLSSSILILGIVSVIQTKKLVILIGTRFFRYANGFSVCMILWIFPSLLNGIFNDPMYYDILLRFHYLFKPFGFLAIAIMIAAMESVKSEGRSMLTNIGFLGAGGLIVGMFSPLAFSLEWTSNGWISYYSPEFELGRMFLFSIVILSALPLGIRVYKRLRNFFQRNRIYGYVFWTVVIIVSSLLLVQPLISLTNLITTHHPYFLYLSIASFLLLITILFRKHPTVLFTGTYEISELYIIRQGSGLPLYHFKFKQGGSDGSEILSAFFTGIKHYLKQTLGKGEVERVLVGDQEMLIQEGIYTYGILIAQESSELTKNLLRTSVNLFEELYQSTPMDRVEVQERKKFDLMIERYFEFALVNIDN